MKGESGEETGTGSVKPSSRMDRRKRELRERILKAASALFIARGAGSVSMDEVAEAADVARRTLFNHFSGKDKLLYEVAAPVLEQAVSLAQVRLAVLETPVDCSGTERKSGDPDSLDERSRDLTRTVAQDAALRAVTGLCLDLWRESGKKLGILYAVELKESPKLAVLHARFLEILMRLMAHAFPSAAWPESSGGAKLAGRILFRTFVPLLSCLSGLPDAEYRFGISMKALLESALTGSFHDGPKARETYHESESQEQ